MKKIPRKRKRISGSFRSPKTAPAEDVPASGSSSLMGVRRSQRPDSNVTAAKIGKRNFQFPRVPAANAAMNGPQNEEMALTTCPAVSELVRALPFTTLVSSGLSDTWRIVFPTPRRTKASMQVTKL